MGRTKGAKNKNVKEKPHKEKPHKEKPHKEKKPKEKKPKESIKQKQKQIQNIKININNNSGDDDKKKKVKELKDVLPMPNISFNPSIAIPQGFPITRPETNPPVYDMSSLLTDYNIKQPVLQPPIPTPPRPTPPTPTPPRPTPPTQPPIKPVDVEPTQPHPNEPINVEPYHPNPQTEQSHPHHPPPHITPTQHTEHINVEPYPYNDILGSSLINLATSIGLGAVTGGASVAAEAGLAGLAEGLAAHGLRGAASGALTGLRSSVPTLSRAAIAGGVATGVSHVVGAGPIGNIVAGTAAGIASRGRGGIIGGAVAGALNNATNGVRGTRVTRPRTRVRLVHEPDNSETSLLSSSSRTFTGPGNIAGGSRTGVSRLVPPHEEIQSAPNTGQQNIMSNIKDIANRTMKKANETASNLKNQISEAGENIVNRVRGRGRPRLVPRSDEQGWEPYERQAEHPLSATTLNQEMKAAATLKGLVKRKAQKSTLQSMRWENEMEQNETNRNAANKLTAALKRTKQQVDYEQDVLMDREIKAKNNKMSKDILNDIVNSSINKSGGRSSAASVLQGAIKRTLPAPKLLKEHYRKKDRAMQNFQKLTENLGDTIQYGKTQEALNAYQAKQQNINNFEKLVNNKVKTANMVATKKDIIAGRAAEILQAMARRKSEKGLVNRKMENAGDILGGVKRERASNKVKAGVKAKLTYQFKDAKQALEPKYTGEPLVVLKGTEGNPKLILKRNHERGVKAAESRKIREDLQDKYKDIMKKTFKGQNRFNPL